MRHPDTKIQCRSRSHRRPSHQAQKQRRTPLHSLHKGEQEFLSMWIQNNTEVFFLLRLISERRENAERTGNSGRMARTSPENLNGLNQRKGVATSKKICQGTSLLTGCGECFESLSVHAMSASCISSETFRNRW